MKDFDLLLGWAVTSAMSFLTIWGIATRSPRSMMCCFCESKADIARATVKKYAYEAYPEWSQQHPTQMCPRSVLDLNEWMNNKDDRDPWGGRYRLHCPWAGRGILVESPGEDGELGTADDIKSWE